MKGFGLNLRPESTLQTGGDPAQIIMLSQSIPPVLWVTAHAHHSLHLATLQHLQCNLCRCSTPATSAAGKMAAPW